ncbi:MAG: MerR family transcriptional regulator, partial [Alphaproteobacteria bacterium]|nr:MerR family transcriptional regulator [Alphaproteobacteria bacterium]
SIRALLYDDGYTIKGVQKLLREGGVRPDEPESTATRESGPADVVRAPQPAAPAPGPAPADRAELKSLLEELQALKKLLDSAR